MPISEENITLMASQRLADTDDGGGRMTGIEIVDGNVNNMFSDISRLDRVYGRVSLRKGFIAVDTDDQEVYNGSHVILTNPAKDPLVNVCLFSTSDPHDERTAARDRIEAYVTRGPKYFSWLWGNQLEGSRSLLLFQSLDSATPDVGDVLYLIENEEGVDEYSQYVRVTGVTTEITNFTITGTYTSTFSRKVVQIEIGDPLRYTFHGGEITNNDSSAFNAQTYTTLVADAAKYYGAMSLTQAAETGDITLSLDSIFTHLVPSAQGEAPLIDLKPGEAGPVIESGPSRTVTAPSFACLNGAQFWFGRGMKPGTVQVAGGRNYTDDGTGLLMEGATVSGTVNYAEGTITWVGQTSWTTACSVTAVVASAVSRITNTLFQVVDINNRGYNFTKILNPPPSPGTFFVDYMSQGKWYRLRDNGAGELVPDLSGTGTGTINYISGSTVLTCAALPDVDSAILYGWGNPLEVEDGSGIVTIDTAEIDHTLAEFPVKTGSVSISWPSGEGTAAMTDDGNGNLTGDGTGTVNYVTGRCLFTPTALPAPDAVYTFDYDKYPEATENASVQVAGGVATIQLGNPPVLAGSVNLRLNVTVSGYSHVYDLEDHGNGTISAPGWSIDKPVSHPHLDGNTTVSGVSGTIDYTLGEIIIDLSSISGNETWNEPVITIQEVF